MNATKFLVVSDGKTIEIIDPKTRATTGSLTIGEAIEQMLGMLRPDHRTYPMNTKREWKALRKERRKHNNFRDLEQLK